MTATFTLTGRILDKSKHPVKRLAIILTATPISTLDGTANEVYGITPQLMTDEDGYICRNVGNKTPSDDPGVTLVVGAQYTLRPVSGLYFDKVTFNAPDAGTTLDLADIIPDPPDLPDTWSTTTTALAQSITSGDAATLAAGEAYTDAETTRATAAEATKVNSSTYTAGLAGKADASALTAETTRATAAEGVNATAISTNTTAIGNEVTRATAAETAIQNGTNTTLEARLSAAYAALPKVAGTVSASGAAVVNKHNPVDATAAARTISLPTGQPEGTQISVEKADTSANAVTITGNIRGVAAVSISLSFANEALVLRADSAGSWWPFSGHRTKVTLDTAYMQKAPALTVERLDRQVLNMARNRSGQAAVDYADAVEITKDWADLTGWQAAANAQVSGNRLYAVSSTNPGGAFRTFQVGATEKAHLTTLLYYKAGGAGPVYFGIDTSAAGSSPVASSPTGMFVGLNSSGQRAQFIGGSVGVAATDIVVIGSNPTVDTTYYATIDIDETWISFSLRAVGSTSDFFSYKMSRASLTAGGKAVNNIATFVTDARGTSGHAIGPVAAVKSLQPTRTKVIASQTVEGVEHRQVVTRSASGDPWRIQIPQGYDSRKPAPVVIFFHQASAGSGDIPVSDSRMQPVTDALGDAGFIVASAFDTGDRWGNSASTDAYRTLYEYVRDHWATSSLFYLGVSMGGLPLLNGLARNALPTPAAVGLISAVVDLDLLWINNTSAFASAIRTAYGIAADGSDYATKTAGFNPVSREGWEFRGAPLRYYTSAGDVTVTKAGHPDILVPKVLPYAPEATEVVGTGGHLDVSLFQAANLTAFFQTYA